MVGDMAGMTKLDAAHRVAALEKATEWLVKLRSDTEM